MRYQRLLQLGSGGMAHVHLSLAVGQSEFKRLVVVKSIREQLLTDPSMRQMFLAEARLSARLNHPNVVQVSEVVDAPEGVMLVMEYLDGLSLAESMRAAGAAFTVPMRLRVLCEVLCGLHYAHELTDYHGKPLGIIHRDVSPQNVFITYDGRVKLLDFGVAKVTASPDQTRTGIVKGRVAYMPAEQISAGTLDRRTDIYAVGCVLWEAIAGSRLWDKQPQAEILRRVIGGDVPRLSSRVEVDPELEKIVSRAISLSPDDRYATAEDMRLAIEGYLSASQQQVSLRAVGELLAECCVGEREERQKQVTDAIAHAERNLSIAPERESRSGTPSGSAIAAGEDSRSKVRARRRGEDSASQSATPDFRAGRKRGLVVLALLAAAAAAAVFFMRARPGVPAVEAVVASPAPRSTSFVLTIDASPRDARITVDGTQATGNPTHVKVTSGESHVVRVELDGFLPSERHVSVDGDMALAIELAPRAEPSAPASRASAERDSPRARLAPVAGVRPAPSPATPTAHAAVNCDPPYYFASGIKTFKPECIQ